VRYAVRRALVVGLFVTVGALAALFVSTGIRARVVDVYLVALAAVLMLMLIRAARTLLPERAASRFDAAHAGLRRRPPKPAELTLERDVELGRLNAFHFHTRVRPVLQEIASYRLRHRYGVELEREPARARELVPSATWDVVRPDRRPPDDRLAPGPSPDSLRKVLAELERL
jgi:hypothetical protein